VEKIMDILLVDDDVAVRAMIGDVLESRGHSLRTAGDGLEALQLMQEALPELVISDVHMPGMGGVELLREIRSRFQEIPVLLIAGMDVKEDVLETGACTLLKKPFQISQLLACLEDIGNQGEGSG
jgi:CheY-like chemotaxis protein